MTEFRYTDHEGDLLSAHPMTCRQVDGLKIDGSEVHVPWSEVKRFIETYAEQAGYFPATAEEPYHSTIIEVGDAKVEISRELFGNEITAILKVMLDPGEIGEDESPVEEGWLLAQLREAIGAHDAPPSTLVELVKGYMRTADDVQAYAKGQADAAAETARLRDWLGRIRGALGLGPGTSVDTVVIAARDALVKREQAAQQSARTIAEFGRLTVAIAGIGVAPTAADLVTMAENQREGSKIYVQVRDRLAAAGIHCPPSETSDRVQGLIEQARRTAQLEEMQGRYLAQLRACRDMLKQLREEFSAHDDYDTSSPGPLTFQEPSIASLHRQICEVLKATE